MPYLLPNSICISWLVLFLSFTGTLPGQKTAFVQLKGDTEFTISAGQETQIQLSFLITEGFHIQAQQVNDENLIPSVLSFEAPDGLVLGDPVFPQADELEMKGEEEAWLVFSDLLEIKVPVTIAKPAEKGTYLVKGNFYYQACDDAKCYFPRDLPFSMNINIK